MPSSRLPGDRLPAGSQDATGDLATRRAPGQQVTSVGHPVAPALPSADMERPSLPGGKRPAGCQERIVSGHEPAANLGGETLEPPVSENRCLDGLRQLAAKDIPSEDQAQQELPPAAISIGFEENAVPGQ